MFFLQACEWEDKIIVVVELEYNFHIYILNSPREEDKQLIVLNPIQKLKKHGHLQNISFFNLDGYVYSLFASTHTDDQR